MKKCCKELCEELSENLKYFLEEVHKKRLSDMATEEWSVKEVLCHIVFWHEYYAQQYKALVEGKEPMVFVGSASRNKDGVKSLQHKSRKELEGDLWRTQEVLCKSVVEGKVAKMTYTKGREYVTEDFLEIVIGHVRRHTTQVKRSKRLG